MTPAVRASVAAIALADASKRSVSHIYSFSESKYRSLEVSVRADNVSGYDYDSGEFIDGTISSVYHYGSGSFIDFNRKQGGSYAGYDYDSGSHFEINVRQSSVEVYDYGEQKWFSYSS